MLSATGASAAHASCAFARWFSAVIGSPRRKRAFPPSAANTAFQIGAAIGVAVVATVSVTRSTDFFAANAHAARLIGLTQGFQSAFLACSVIAAAGALTALALLGRPKLSSEEALDPATVPIGD